MSEYWNPQMETMKKAELDEIKLKRIKAIVSYAYRNSQFYKELYDEMGVNPEDVKTYDDFRNKITLFRKDQIRDKRVETGDPFGTMLTIPPDQIERIHPSTGTTGAPTFTALTAEEVHVASEPCTRLAWMWKIRPGMRLLSAIHFVGFWGWWSTFLGVLTMNKLGLNTELIAYNAYLHLFGFPTARMSLGKFKGDWALLPPDTALACINEFAKMGKDPKDAIPGLKYVTSAGEAISPKHRKYLMEKFGLLDWFDAWGCSDPFTIAGECHVHDGLHAYSDYWTLELIDTETEELLGPGERGEIVVTNLWMRALPFIRFGTEDFGEQIDETCDCGRTHPRVKVYDRASWVVDVAGKKVSPFSLRLIMERHPETEEASFNIIKDAKKMNILKIKASYKEGITKDPEELKNRIAGDIKKELGVEAEIEWIPYEQLHKTLHKITRMVDLTKEG
ncbi:MAG: phenylacetate--CoA ligase family protein [Candidatus Jordarchaeum sp.]|uniref:phenylacetate--CoA ligase family protein n=1 Tax=Candidatus Jordarchaeum sp. TaxID=2823881 RepID=UPI0040490E13